MTNHTRGFASKQVLLTAVAQEILSPSENRQGLIICPPLQGSAFIGMDNTITAGNGIPLYWDSNPLILMREQVGDIVRRGLWAIGLSAYGQNRNYATGRLFDYQTGPGAVIATLVCPASSYVVIDGYSGSVDKNELTYLLLSDTTPQTYLRRQFMAGVDISLAQPIIVTAGLNGQLVVNNSATSTATYASIWGRSFTGVAGLSSALRLTVIEIFDCGCADFVANDMLHMGLRR